MGAVVCPNTNQDSQQYISGQFLFCHKYNVIYWFCQNILGNLGTIKCLISCVTMSQEDEHFLILLNGKCWLPACYLCATANFLCCKICLIYEFLLIIQIIDFYSMLRRSKLMLLLLFQSLTWGCYSHTMHIILFCACVGSYIFYQWVRQ